MEGVRVQGVVADDLAVAGDELDTASAVGRQHELLVFADGELRQHLDARFLHHDSLVVGLDLRDQRLNCANVGAADREHDLGLMELDQALERAMGMRGDCMQRGTWTERSSSILR